MGFERDQQQDKKQEPHPDWRQNVEQFERMIRRTYWLPEYIFESSTPDGKKFINYTISDSILDSVYDPTIEKHVTTVRVKEYKHATFVWGIKGQYQKSHPLSFHQENKNRQKEEGFAYEIAGLLNKLGSEGFILHREKENDGRPRKAFLHRRERGSRSPEESKGEAVIRDKNDRICPIEIWVDIPEKGSVYSQPDEWEKMFGRS